LNPHVKDNKLIASTGGGVISFVKKCPKERFVGAVYCIMWSLELAVACDLAYFFPHRKKTSGQASNYWSLVAGCVFRNKNSHHHYNHHYHLSTNIQHIH
jgi:hypothetical protein